MAKTRRAVIDVGTNSVKLLVADVAGSDVEPILETSAQTRLGRGLYESHQLQPEALKQTAKVVSGFASKARALRARSVRVIATSAARDARNSQDLISAIKKESGLKAEIITGNQEADWAFQGVTSDKGLVGVPLLLIDVGGGSTEFILGMGKKKYFRQSFPIGTLRLLEKFPYGDPPSRKDWTKCRDWLKAFLRYQVQPALAPAMKREAKLDPRHRQARLIGTGGTATILARMERKLDRFDRGEIEGVILKKTQVRKRRQMLWKLPIEERREIIGLPAKRADIILTGVAIYEVVMEELGFPELRISTRGLRFAAVMG